MNKKFIILVLGFLFIFMGYEVAQQYLASIFHTQNIESMSLISLSLIYLFMAVFGFFAPAVIRKIGLSRALFISSLFYPAYIISVITRSQALIYLTSILLGIAASILWTANGTYLVKISGNKSGFFTGVFMSIIKLGPTLVLLAVSFLINVMSFNMIYIILFLLAGAGSAVMFFLPEIDKTRQIQLNTLQMLSKRKMLLFIPFILSSSFMIGLTFSKIPIRITDLFGLSYVGKISSIIILLSFIIPIITGKLSDRFGFKNFIYLGMVSGITGFLMIMNTNSLLLFSLGIFFVGISTGVWFAIAYPAVSALFSKDLDSAMAVRSMMSSLGIFSAVILSVFLGYFTLVLLGIGLFSLALISSILLLSKNIY